MGMQPRLPCKFGEDLDEHQCGERASVRRGFDGGLLGISADFDDLDRKLAVSRPTFFTCDLAGLRETQAKALGDIDELIGVEYSKTSWPGSCSASRCTQYDSLASALARPAISSSASIAPSVTRCAHRR
jgi:hypothetical protein